MIYLIEDKTARRIDYGWTNEKLNSYSNYIKLIENVDALEKNISNILSHGNIVIYHESFINSVDYYKKHVVNDMLSNIKDNNQQFACFSGSISQRTLDQNVCSLPAFAMYINLEYFLQKIHGGENNFKYLMFGSNPEIEEKLEASIITVNEQNQDHNKFKTNKNFFFFLSSDEALEPPFEDMDEDGNFDFVCDDENLCKTIYDDLSIIKYDGIFIPLCFGETLSDFLGLRLAMLIRFSEIANKKTPIVIYGTAEYSDIIEHECFDILKTAGVYYVNSDYDSLINISSCLNEISDVEYRNGLKAIHLNIPSDIGDNHNISNKWAIHRWAQVLDDSDRDIDKLEKKISSNLYFKYLSSLNAIQETNKIANNDLIIKEDKLQPKLKVLYVDDQADEGWDELMCKIIHDENNIEYNSLISELKDLSKEALIELVKDKVIETAPNVVILDLRLHKSDFNGTPIEEITGYRILQAIKHINRGIQVLVFSATKKIWNLQSLSNAGADGFITKESPEDSKDPQFTAKTIHHFISCMGACAKQTYRLDLWHDIQDDRLLLKNLSKGKKRKIDKEYAKAVDTLLSMAEDSMFAKGMKYSYASVFMNFFRIIEATANQWIEDVPYQKNGDYYFKFRIDDKILSNFKDSEEFNSTPTGDLICKKPSLPYFQKICNTLHRVGAYSANAFDVVNKRNAFTHPNMTKQDTLETFSYTDIINAFEIVHKLIQSHNSK